MSWLIIIIIIIIIITIVDLCLGLSSGIARNWKKDTSFWLSRMAGLSASCCIGRQMMVCLGLTDVKLTSLTTCFERKLKIFFSSFCVKRH